MSSKIKKINQAVNSFHQQVKLATGKVEEVFRLLKAHRNDGWFSELNGKSTSIDLSNLGVKASELSEKEIAELMGYKLVM